MSVYLIRANSGELTSELTGAKDCLFINQRFDTQTLPEGLYVHCTFANMSFLRTRLERVRFSACVFEACYFRETTFDACVFSGTRFIDCEFVKPNLLSCDFRYARFSGCFPPSDEIESSLPPEHNMRAALTSNLATEADTAGDGNEARKYALRAIEARERHLLAAVVPKTDYYRSHFPTSLDRLAALWRYLLSRLNGVLWGYGERGWPLLRSLVVITFIAFPVLFLLSRNSIENGQGQHPGFGSCVWLSMGSIVSNSGVTGLTATGFARAFVLTEAGIGLLLLGLFVTYVFQYVSRR
jgi:Pentapeptide repeats (9 copies)